MSYLLPQLSASVTEGLGGPIFFLSFLQHFRKHEGTAKYQEEMLASLVQARHRWDSQCIPMPSRPDPAIGGCNLFGGLGADKVDQTVRS